MHGNNETFSDFVPFHIDDGELDGLTPQQVFTLGVEWHQVFDAVERGEPFNQRIHAANVERLSKMLDEKGARYEVVWSHDDWAELIIAMD